MVERREHMKIAIFTDTYFPQVSGVATSIKILQETFTKHGHEVYIFTTTDPNAPKEETNVFRYESVPFLFFKERRIALTFFGPVVKKVKELGIDVIHTQTEFSMGLLGITASRLLNLPLVHTYHTWYEKYLHYIMNGKLVSKETVKRLSRLYCQQGSVVVTPSDTIKDVLRDYHVTRRIVTIPTGVPIPEKLPNSQLQNLRNELGLTADDFVMLSINRLAHEKNLEALIDYMPHILMEKPEAKLVLVGAGPEEDALKERVQTLNLESVVLFPGAVPHEFVNQYYQMADLYVNLSTTETQGLTFLEAITNHLPIVAYASEYLQHLNGIAPVGRLVDTEAAFPEAVLDVAHHLPQAKASLSDLVSIVSSETFYESLYELYQSVEPRKSLVGHFKLLKY